MYELNYRPGSWDSSAVSHFKPTESYPSRNSRTKLEEINILYGINCIGGEMLIQHPVCQCMASTPFWGIMQHYNPVSRRQKEVSRCSWRQSPQADNCIAQQSQQWWANTHILLISRGDASYQHRARHPQKFKQNHSYSTWFPSSIADEGEELSPEIWRDPNLTTSTDAAVVTLSDLPKVSDLVTTSEWNIYYSSYCSRAKKVRQEECFFISLYSLSSDKTSDKYRSTLETCY